VSAALPRSGRWCWAPRCSAPAYLESSWCRGSSSRPEWWSCWVSWCSGWPRWVRSCWVPVPWHRRPAAKAASAARRRGSKEEPSLRPLVPAVKDPYRPCRPQRSVAFSALTPPKRHSLDFGYSRYCFSGFFPDLPVTFATTQCCSPKELGNGPWCASSAVRRRYCVSGVKRCAMATIHMLFRHDTQAVNRRGPPHGREKGLIGCTRCRGAALVVGSDQYFTLMPP
jgi:hypothetical protein